MTLHVLVADDDPILQAIAGEYLRGVGFRVTVVGDGEEALRAVARGRFDLIVTDMVMPNLDGIELIKALKQAAADTPVVAISGGIAGENAEVILRAAVAVGAASVVVKPLVQTTFLAAVASALEGGARTP